MGALISRDILANYLKTIPDEKKLKLYLINQCAPVIKELKPATLLMIKNQKLKEFHILATEWELDWFMLYQGNQTSSVLLFHIEDLQYCLKQAEVVKFLNQMGYEKMNLEDMLRKLGVKIQQFYECKCEYPHEMGAFLGYPIGDVIGFLTKKGEQVLYRGYWNVYCDVELAKSMFAAYDCAREELLWKMLKEERGNVRN